MKIGAGAGTTEIAVIDMGRLIKGVASAPAPVAPDSGATVGVSA